jgi:RHS repeat-associated protein
VTNSNLAFYRGYQYDTETGLYYCQSRYYNSNIGRWLNADDIKNTVNGYAHIADGNIYAFCLNNPVNFSDNDGQKVGIKFGRNYDLGNGYWARFDYGKVGNADHVHIWKGKSETNASQRWAYKLDGSISHEGSSSEGAPPKNQIKKLKKLSGFDFYKKRQNYEKKNTKSRQSVPFYDGLSNLLTVTCYNDNSAMVYKTFYPNLSQKDAQKLGMQIANRQKITVKPTLYLAPAIMPVAFPAPILVPAPKVFVPKLPSLSPFAPAFA